MEPETELIENLTPLFDEQCKKAAKAIVNANAMFLGTGAGFSKDSGLAVYKDIADIPAWNDRNLDYTDLCQPKWLQKQPELFYGFWGTCFNDYREKKPHQGYHIIQRWKNDILMEIQNRNLWRQHWITYSRCDVRLLTPQEMEAEILDPFYVYTSNVDHHHHRFFSPYEVEEIHGTTEKWQCARGSDCSEQIWDAPEDFKFVVDPKTMLAPKDPFGLVSNRKERQHSGEDVKDRSSKSEENKETQPTEHKGEEIKPVKGEEENKQPNPLKNEEEEETKTAKGEEENKQPNPLKSEEEETKTAKGEEKEIKPTNTAEGIQNDENNNNRAEPSTKSQKATSTVWGNHPTCPHCGELARPAILMFGDSHWVWETSANQDFSYVLDDALKSSDFKLVVLEIGCGMRIPSVRWRCERFLSHANVTFIRINPDYPGPESLHRNRAQFVPIASDALPALLKIDEYVKQFQLEKQASEPSIKAENEHK